MKTPDCGEAPAGKTPPAVVGFAAFGLTFKTLPGRGFAKRTGSAMNDDPVDRQNRTPTEPAGENPFGRPFLPWFALVESAVAGLAASPDARKTYF